MQLFGNPTATCPLLSSPLGGNCWQSIPLISQLLEGLQDSQVLPTGLGISQGIQPRQPASTQVRLGSAAPLLASPVAAVRRWGAPAASLGDGGARFPVTEQRNSPWERPAFPGRERRLRGPGGAGQCCPLPAAPRHSARGPPALGSVYLFWLVGLFMFWTVFVV